MFLYKFIDFAQANRNDLWIENDFAAKGEYLIMNTSSVAFRFFRLLLVSCSVYLFFRYAFFVLVPFLAAYVLMRWLYPSMQFLHERWHLPRFLSHYGTLAVFLAAVAGALLFLVWKLCAQCCLFFQNFPVYRQLIQQSFERQTTRLCHYMDCYFCLETGTVSTFVEEKLCTLDESSIRQIVGNAGKMLLNCLSGSFQVFAGGAMLLISMIILVKELPVLQKMYRNSPYYAPLHHIFGCLKKSGLTYLKVELIILLINWGICSVGLFLIGNPYFFLFGMAIAVFDAFPVMGSGLIFLPWGIYQFLERDYYVAAVLVTTYLLTLFIREYLEARLLGQGMGLNPFFMLAAIFAGVKLFGVTGIFLGPLAVVLIEAVLSARWS